MDMMKTHPQQASGEQVPVQITCCTTTVDATNARTNNDNCCNVSSCRPNRTLFVAIVGLLALAYHIVLAVAANFIPDHAVAAGATIYASLGATLSVAGILGAFLKRRGPMCAFSLFLLADAIIAAACRLLVLRIFADMLFLGERGACTDGAWLGFSDWAAAAVEQRAPRHGVVTSAAWQRAHSSSSSDDLRPAAAAAGCGWTLAVLQVLAVGLVLGMAMVQGALAMAVRKCGNEIQKEAAAAALIEHRAQRCKQQPRVLFVADRKTDEMLQLA